MNTISETFRWRALGMLARIEESRHLIQHNGLFGENNEGILAETLNDYLDEHWTIGSGEIIDIDGRRSPQCDIVIYNAQALPRAFRSSTGKVIVLAHAVGAVIEVKTSVLSSAGEDSTSVKGFANQTEKIQKFLTEALAKGNQRLRNRKQEQLASEFDHVEPSKLVQGFAYTSDLLAETLQQAFADHLRGEGNESSFYVLDVKRDAAALRSEFDSLVNPRKNEILEFARRARMPNGYRFNKRIFEEHDGKTLTQHLEHIEKERLGEDCLRQFVKRLSEGLHSSSPGSVPLAPEYKEAVYSAYNTWSPEI